MDGELRVPRARRRADCKEPECAQILLSVASIAGRGGSGPNSPQIPRVDFI